MKCSNHKQRWQITQFLEDEGVGELGIPQVSAPVLHEWIKSVTCEPPVEQHCIIAYPCQSGCLMPDFAQHQSSSLVRRGWKHVIQSTNRTALTQHLVRVREEQAQWHPLWRTKSAAWQIDCVKYNQPTVRVCWHVQDTEAIIESYHKEHHCLCITPVGQWHIRHDF